MCRSGTRARAEFVDDELCTEVCQTRHGPRKRSGGPWLARCTSSVSDDYVVTDLVAWKVAFDRVADMQTLGELKVTLRVVVVV